MGKIKKILLNRSELADINNVLEDFPSIKNFELEYTPSNGIGSCLNIHFELNIKDFDCNVIIPITSEDDW